MYKLTLGSINEIKASAGYSGTIKKGRVALIGTDGKYLNVDGTFTETLKNGQTRTFDALLDDDKAINYYCELYEDKELNTVPLYIWDGEIHAQSDFEDEDAFIEYLVDEGKVVIQGYENPVYELDTVTVSDGGDGYTEASIVVTIPGREGDTPGTITCTVTDGVITSAVVTTAGEYQVKTATQDVDVGTKGGVLTVTMTKA